MEMKDLDAGMRLEAKVLSRGVRENLRLEGALEAYAEIEVTHFNGESFKAPWSGLLMTRDGGRNSRTFRCLAAMGCGENVVQWLNDDFKPRRVEVIIGERPNAKRPLDPGFKYIEWINKHKDSRPNPDLMNRLKKLGFGSDAETPEVKPTDDDGMPF